MLSKLVCHRHSGMSFVCFCSVPQTARNRTAGLGRYSTWSYHPFSTAGNPVRIRGAWGRRHRAGSRLLKVFRNYPCKGIVIPGDETNGAQFKPSPRPR